MAAMNSLLSMLASHPSKHGQSQVRRPSQASMYTYLFLLLIEVVNNDADKEVQDKE